MSKLDNSDIKDIFTLKNKYRRALDVINEIQEVKNSVKAGEALAYNSFSSPGPKILHIGYYQFMGFYSRISFNGNNQLVALDEDDIAYFKAKYESLAVEEDKRIHKKMLEENKSLIEKKKFEISKLQSEIDQLEEEE